MMRVPTEEEITQALHANATEVDGEWWFSDGLDRGIAPKLHDAKSARDIVESCLALDVVVTDVFTAEQWTGLVRAVAALEARVRELEFESDDRRTWEQEQSERNDD